MATSLDKSRQMDFAGLALKARDLDLSGNLDVTGTFSVTGATASDITIGVGFTLNLDSSTATLVANATTLTKYAAVITTEALTTAGAASQAFVITKTGVTAGDLAFITDVGGTNTTRNYSYIAVTTTNTVTVTVFNNTAATALNGTLKFNLLILKA